MYGQFEFECVNSAWSATSNFLESTSFDRTTLTSTSAAVSANNRTDCGYCLNPIPSVLRLGALMRSTIATVSYNNGGPCTHIYTFVSSSSGCTGCSQPLCYITDTTYPTTGNNYSTACCNYYQSNGTTCINACPPSSYPDASRTCGKNRSDSKIPLHM